MWFLEHESLFGGKRVWLRPGSQQLFGRTKHGSGDDTEGKKVFIDNKNVSRKHMMIRVLQAPPEDGTNLHTRSRVEITDLSCRQGTTIDAHVLKSTKEADGTLTYDRTILSGTEHTIRLSQSHPAFTIKWHDLVFTFTSKDTERNKARNMKLHAVDIKTSSEFVTGKTTHVVSQKRNLPKVLQALVAGVPIVTAEYLDLVLDAVTPSEDAEQNYIPSPLEQDYDKWWPSEKDHIPPAGAEPVARPGHMLEPDSSRSEMFSSLTFVFLDGHQFSSLHSVIENAGGKARHFEIDYGKTTPDDYVIYVRSIAAGKQQSQGDMLTVITVRLPNYPDGFDDWAANFVRRVDQYLNQRSILQNEFLDAIVTKDISSLQKLPTEILDLGSSVPSAPQHVQSIGKPVSAVQSQIPLQAPQVTAIPLGEALKVNPRKRPIRRVVASRFTGFDDYEPPTKTRKIEEIVADTEQSMPVQDPLPEVPATQAHQYGQSQLDEAATRDEQLAEMFPAAAAIKQQRAAIRAPSALVEPEEQTTTSRAKSKAIDLVTHLQKSKEKVDKKVDVREQARKRMEQDQERHRAEEASLQEALEDVEISEIRARTKFGEMTMRAPRERPEQRTQVQSERWRAEWNGRKNFKGFRRRGERRPSQTDKVFVSFVEAPQKKGFGDVFFLEETGPPVRTKEDERRLKRRMGKAAEGESEAETGFNRRKRTKVAAAAAVVDVEESEQEHDERSEGYGITQRSSERSQRVQETQINDTQTQKITRKGPSRTVVGESSTKQSRAARRDANSDDEETGFRFRRRA